MCVCVPACLGWLVGLWRPSGEAVEETGVEEKWKNKNRCVVLISGEAGLPAALPCVVLLSYFTF